MTMSLRSLTFLEISQLTEKNRFSFFVNLYNVLILHATCVLGTPADNPIARTSFFNGSTGAIYQIGGYDFSADDIEHGILRANHPHPSQTSSSYFPSQDPRAVLSLKSLDPRLHFILNCGARSCPPIKILSGDPEEALRLASSAYLDGEVRVDLLQNKLFLPRLSLWYGADFSTTLTGRVEILLSLLSDARRQVVSADIDKLRLADGSIGESCVEYNVYNWVSNDNDNNKQT
jgi:hypothetical protein